MSSLIASVKSLLSKDEGPAAPESPESVVDDGQQQVSASAAEDSPSTAEGSEAAAKEPEPKDLPPADDAGEDQDQGDDDQDEDGDPDPNDDSPEAVERRKGRAQKKVLKEIALRKEAEKKSEALRARVEQLEAELPEGNGAELDSVDAIDSRRMEIRDLVRRLDAAIQAGGYEGKDPQTGEEVTLSVEQLQEHKYRLEDERDIALPKAERTLQQRRKFDEEAGDVYPDLLDDESDLSKAAAELFREIPVLKRHPQALMLAGDLLAGRAARSGRKKPAPTKPAPKTEAKPMAKTPPKEPARGANTGSSVSTDAPNPDSALLAAVSKQVLRKHTR